MVSFLSQTDQLIMELPRPPDDPEMKNIIDKLAQFVARSFA
jgi:hypothetical protein